MQMVDAVDTAAARPLIKTDNIFGIIVTYGLQIAELTLTGRFVRHDIRTAVWWLFIKYNK